MQSYDLRIGYCENMTCEPGIIRNNVRVSPGKMHIHFKIIGIMVHWISKLHAYA